MTDTPNPLEAAIECVIAQMTEKDAISLMNSTPEGILMMQFGLGPWIRNNFELWGGSPLRDFLEAKGFYHEDDMSAALIIAVRARLRGENCEDALTVEDPGHET